jgi:phytoene dehydrogenase-like protein
VKDGVHDLLAEFPRDHAYRLIVEIPAQFASDLHGTLPPFAIARLQGAWTRGVVRLARGEEEITEFLVERVRAHGGEVALADRASAITHRGGKVTGVVLDGSDETTGVQFVVAELPTRTLLDLASGFVPSRRQLLALPMAAPRGRRFVVGIAVKDAGIPRALAAESFIIPDFGGPVVQRPPHKPSEVPAAPTHAASEVTLLVAETLLEGDAKSRIAAARESVLACVQQFLPFVEDHYLAVDSAHDGRPLWDFRDGRRKDVDRSRVRATGAGLDAEPMIPQYAIEPSQLHGLGGEPLRTPLAGAFVVGRTTMPALGQEGELLAAWGAARMITRTDRRKEKMRRDMWSKVELG